MMAPIQPWELKIEITDACQLRCDFCRQGGPDSHGIRFMPEDEVLAWIDWAVENDIPGVRFTGGEPTLHPSIKFFCSYARLRGRYIILNSNGMADAGLYRDLFRLVNDVRVSLPTLDAGRMDAITGGRAVLEKKQRVIELAATVPRLRIGLLTVLDPELHRKLEPFVLYAQSLASVVWLPLRFESTPVLPRPWSRQDAQKFAEELAELKDRYPAVFPGMGSVAPFCAVTPASLGARVFGGRCVTCGPFRALNVDIDGNLMACFATGKFGKARPLDEVRQSGAICDYASLNRLPAECQRCEYVDRCGGGCPKPFGVVEHEGRQIDYLAGFASEADDAGKECG